MGGKGISTMEETVWAVPDWPTPTNQKQLKSFLGLASSYRRIVRGFSGQLSPCIICYRKIGTLCVLSVLSVVTIELHYITTQ